MLSAQQKSSTSPAFVQSQDVTEDMMFYERNKIF